ADLTSAEIDPVHPWPADFSSNARVRATDGSDIFAIAGALSFAIANGGSGKATAVAFGVAIAVNTIVTGTNTLAANTGTKALVDHSSLTWGDGTTGGLTVTAGGRRTLHRERRAHALVPGPPA